MQDFAGRHVLFFKGRRNGFMPEYVDHPVKDLRTWEEQIAWRLAVDAPGRFDDLVSHMAAAQAAAAEGLMISQNLIGGYMYLRSLIGPADLLYAFYDQPELIHRCMAAWLTLADAVTARHQEHVTFDEIFLAEDICYNHGPLISPRMMKEFLFPYYQQLIANVKARQIDKSRHLYVQIDTDGYAVPTIPLYIAAIGMDVMSPFEVASGCDVVEIGGRYPELAMFGGIDKRVLASGRAAIDAHLAYILPAMRAPRRFHSHLRPRRARRSAVPGLSLLPKTLHRAGQRLERRSSNGWHPAAGLSCAVTTARRTLKRSGYNVEAPQAGWRARHSPVQGACTS